MTIKNNQNNTLFLWLDDREFYAINAKKRGVDVRQTYKDMNFIGKVIRRLQIYLNLQNVSLWMHDWKNELEKYETVIVHASILTPAVVSYIRKNNKNIRIIVWYWNPVDKCVDINKFDNLNCEIWSFDESDCEKYNLKYNTQYYFNNVELPKKNKKEIDVFFVGGDKGRIVDLINLKTILDAQDVSNYFHITPTGKENVEYKDFYSSRISYEEVLMYIGSSKVIVDYVSDNQSGLTLRPLEALFFNKKLITNDSSIKNRDFYKKENIFIYGKDDINDLLILLNTPYKKVDNEIINKYDFDNWLNRFLDEKEIEKLL